jgi:branched-chain amino acid transport system permease protein
MRRIPGDDLFHLLVLTILVALPFILALMDGQPFGEILANEAGNSKFIQGLMIEVFILAIYALSYDLILGVTGLLSFGHAMFFAVGAYATGVALKIFGWGLGPTLLAVIGVGIVQAMLFGVVLPRVKGITFALVTLGLASVFEIVIRTREMVAFTGADVGLQGIPRPDLLNPVTERLRFYYVALFAMVFAFLLFRRFVNSPTGRVCVAIRENEDRAKMLGYNTFTFKMAALTLASITAALAGMLHTLFKPLVSPEIASLGYTVDALLMILIGGIGTLSGALAGAGVFRLMDFYLHKWYGEAAGFLIGAVYVAIVIFLPYGLVGTWRSKSFSWREGWARVRRLFGV